MARKGNVGKAAAADTSYRVGLRGEIVTVDPYDLTFAELDEVARLQGLLPNRGDAVAIVAAAQAFVVLRRSATFAAWDDDTFRGLKLRDVDLDPPEEAPATGEA